MVCRRCGRTPCSGIHRIARADRSAYVRHSLHQGRTDRFRHPVQARRARPRGGGARVHVFLADHLNDLFIGPRSHTSARYRLGIGDRAEDQSSSGIIVSTGLGATGWLRSIITGAGGIAGALSGRPLKLTAPRTFKWDADYLYFSVREPWPSRTSAAEIAFGKITATTPLVLESRMPEGGVIFSDGIESDFVRFNAGACATIRVADRQGRLVT